MTAPTPTAFRQSLNASSSQKIIGGFAIPTKRRVRSHGASQRVSFSDTVVTKQTSLESDSVIGFEEADKADWEARKDAEIAQAVDFERRRASQVEAQKDAEIEELRRQLANLESRTQLPLPPSNAQQEMDCGQESASMNNFPDRRSTKSFIRLHLNKIVGGGAAVANEISLSDDGSRCKLETSAERKKISIELFKELDTTGLSQLGPQQLLPLAELIGFEGTQEDWVKEYDVLSQRYDWDPQTGAGYDQFMRMINDEGSSAHLTDFELRLLLAELESHHEGENGHAHGTQSRRESRSSSVTSLPGHNRQQARRKSVYESGHPHRRKSMIARVDCGEDADYANEY